MLSDFLYKLKTKLNSVFNLIIIQSLFIPSPAISGAVSGRKIIGLVLNKDVIWVSTWNKMSQEISHFTSELGNT